MYWPRLCCLATRLPVSVSMWSDRRGWFMSPAGAVWVLLNYSLGEVPPLFVGLYCYHLSLSSYIVHQLCNTVVEVSPARNKLV